MSTIKVGDVRLHEPFAARAKEIIHSSSNVFDLMINLSELIGVAVDATVVSVKGDEIEVEPISSSELQDVEFCLVQRTTRKEWRFQGRGLPKTYAAALFAFYGEAQLTIPYVLRSASPDSPGLVACTYSRRIWIPGSDEEHGVYATAEGIVVQRMYVPDEELQAVLHMPCAHVPADAPAVEHDSH